MEVQEEMYLNILKLEWVKHHHISINTTDSTLNWNIALNSVFDIKTINSTTENVGTLNVCCEMTVTR